MSVALERVSKRFGEYVALDEVTFRVDEGELVALVTLVVRFWLEARHGDALARAHRRH